MSWQEGFEAFGSKLEELSYFEMVREATLADRHAANASKSKRKGASAARAAGAAEFVARTGRLLFWLRHGALPDGATDGDLAIYRRLKTRLVERGEFKADAIAP